MRLIGGETQPMTEAAPAAVLAVPRRYTPLALLLAGLLQSAALASPAPRVVRFTVLQMNDVYEITPVSGEGGLARVATLRKRLLRNNPNTITVLDGDLFSPSALGTARVNGDRLAGKQIVAVMNRVGLDHFTFGNHEFDPTEPQFRQRMAESRFHYLSSNVKDAQGRPFPNVPEDRILTFSSPAGAIKVGLFGLTIDSNRKPYVLYQDPFEAAAKEVARLRPRVSVLLAMTHLSFDEDRRLADEQPQIDAILGGHEHVHHQYEKGGAAPIYKADANARTVWIHYFAYDLAARRLRKHSILREIGPNIPEDPVVKSEVDRWVRIAYAGFRKEGFEPSRQVAATSVSLDGSEASVRAHPTRLTAIIAKGMRAEMPEAQIALYNGGSIRIDDVITPGPITEYDIIRILPFGGKIVLVEVRGELLRRVLTQGLMNSGTGGYLQSAGAAYRGSGQAWMIGGEDLDPVRTYRVAVNDFLLTGAEQGLGFFSRTATDVKVIREGRDIRQTTIAEMQKTFPPRARN